MTLREMNERFHSGGITRDDFVAAMHPVHLQLLDYASWLKRTLVARIEIVEEAVILTCRSGLRLRYDDPEEQYSVLSLLNFGNYEPGDSDMLFRLAGLLAAERPLTFLDIGANLGYYALSVGLAHPAAEVHAFEPVPHSFRGLERNLAVNGLGNVHLHNLGFLAEPGPRDFFLNPRISGRASVRNLAADPGAQPVTCAVARLDDFVQAHGLAPDLVKIDVEGAELAVLRGGLETLARHRPLLMLEMMRKWAGQFGYHPNEIIGLLGGLGYRCYRMEWPGLVPFPAMTEDTVATNFFFLHERHAALRSAIV